MKKKERRTEKIRNKQIEEMRKLFDKEREIIEGKKLLFYMKHLTLDRKLFYNKKRY